MWQLLGSKFDEMMQDDGRRSFGKSVSLPFLGVACLLGAGYGGYLLWHADTKGDAIPDLIWTLSGVATLLYASYKTGSVIIRKSQGKVEAGNIPTPPEPPAQ